MVAPLNDLSQQYAPPAPVEGAAPANPATLPDGSPVTTVLSAQDLAAQLNSQMSQNSEFMQSTQQSIAQLHNTQQQSLDQFSRLAQTIADGQQSEQQARAAAEQARIQQANQPQPLQAPQYTQEEQEAMRDNPALASITQKNAEYLAQRAAQGMQERYDAALTQNTQGLQNQIAELRQQNVNSQQSAAQQFDASINAYATGLGIDLRTIDQTDPNWRTYMDRPISPMSSDTVRQTMQAAATALDPNRSQAGLLAFVQEFYPERLPQLAQNPQGQQPPQGQQNPQMQPGQQQYQQPGQQPPPQTNLLDGLEGPGGYPDPSQLYIPPPGAPQQQLYDQYGQPVYQAPQQQQVYQSPAQQQQQQQVQYQQGQRPSQVVQQGAPAASQARTPQSTGTPPVDINHTLQQLMADQNELRQARDRQTISGEEFDEKMAGFNQQLFALRQQQQQQQQG